MYTDGCHARNYHADPGLERKDLDEGRILFQNVDPKSSIKQDGNAQGGAAAFADWLEDLVFMDLRLLFR